MQFNVRRFSTLCIAFSCSVIIFTGAVLLLAPHELGWRLFWLDEGAYKGLHQMMAIIFIPSLATHLYYNWKPIVSYFRTKTLKISREFITAAALNLALIALTLTAYNILIDPKDDMAQKIEEFCKEAKR
ncbi:MAG: DUF4405 domain-containing protein [Campylobacteraceae bacterium]|jgi:hypothetical protein|nr:DUF4405 domain-containing protein [Campylobacteraceae bacterium]